MNLQGLAGDKRRNVLVGGCFESCGHRFTGGPGLKEVQISFPSGCFSAETLWLPVEPGVAFQVSHCLID
jgi:hypothetical protein